MSVAITTDTYPRHLRLFDAASAPRDPLLARAQRLWPDDERNQREWLRAVSVVRKTTRGWRLDNPVKREAQQ